MFVAKSVQVDSQVQREVNIILFKRKVCDCLNYFNFTDALLFLTILGECKWWNLRSTTPLFLLYLNYYCAAFGYWLVWTVSQSHQYFVLSTINCNCKAPQLLDGWMNIFCVLTDEWNLTLELYTLLQCKFAWCFRKISIKLQLKNKLIQNQTDVDQQDKMWFSKVSRCHKSTLQLQYISIGCVRLHI